MFRKILRGNRSKTTTREMNKNYDYSFNKQDNKYFNKSFSSRNAIRDN